MGRPDFFIVVIQQTNHDGIIFAAVSLDTDYWLVNQFETVMFE